jgi:hypothetical protein
MMIISVHAKHQTTKENISEKDSREMTLQKDMKFLELRWDYSELIATYEKQLLFT